MTGIKFVETLEITFEKQQGKETIYKEAYFNSTPQIVLNETEIQEALQVSEQQILNKIQQWISEGSAWLINSVNSHYINVVNQGIIIYPIT